MIKTLAIAALVSGLVTLPVATVQAAAESNCLIFPLLQPECREAISDAMHGGARTVAAAATETAAAASDAGAESRVLFWWKECTRAPAGSGHLLDCE